MRRRLLGRNSLRCLDFQSRRMNGLRWLPLRFVWTACLISLAGCDSDLAPVSGRVTLDGQPLAGAVVTFQPKTGRDSTADVATGSVGRTDEEGRYTLRLIRPDKHGAVVGEHSVTISALKGGSDEAPATGPKLPKAWSDGSKRFKVAARGTTDANFEITSATKAGK
jgi:hypothetical protein